LSELFENVTQWLDT